MKATADACRNIRLTYRRVKCKICYGTGKDTTNSQVGAQCSKCDGKGWRLFPRGATETCSSCSGRGRDFRFNRNGQICQDCDGFGEVKRL